MDDRIFIIATGNAGKRREFEALLGDFLPDGVDLVDRKGWEARPGATPIPEVDETGETFAQNAVKKALEVSRSTGVSVLADDSGLEVAALGGRPGVHSARYAGEEADDAANNARLMEELDGVPTESRSARYRAVVCLALNDDAVGRELFGRIGTSFESVEPADVLPPEATLRRMGDRVVVWFGGSCRGTITTRPRGEGGFGYDPYFLVEEWGESMAEIPLEKKNRRSHRAAAVREMKEFFASGG